MSSFGRRRAPLADVSNLPHSTAAAPSPYPAPSEVRPPRFPPSAIQRSINPKLHTENVPSQSSPLPPTFHLRSDGGGQEITGSLSPLCRSLSRFPLSAAQEALPSTPAVAMDVDLPLSTPRSMEVDEPSFSSARGSFFIYSRRKPVAPSHLTTMSCPPLGHHRKEIEMEHWNQRPVKRSFAATMLNREGDPQGASKRVRRRSLPNPQLKPWLPEGFVAAQRSHFAEVDAFELSEEEGELSDED